MYECFRKLPLLVIGLTSITSFGFAFDSEAESLSNQHHNNQETPIKISGSISFDGSLLTSQMASENLTQDLYLRKLKLGFEKEFIENWMVELTLDLEEDADVKLDDYAISYGAINDLDIAVGVVDIELGLQNSTSSKVSSTLEKDLGTNALIPKGKFGLALQWHQKHYSAFFNMFESNRDFNTGNNTYGLSAKLNYVFSKDYHFGVNVALVDYGSQLFEINAKPELNLADDLIQSDAFRARSLRFFALEYAQRYNQLNLQSEVMWLFVTADQEFNPVNPNSSHSSAYLQASYFVKGDANKFKKGNYAKRSDTQHALELVTRLSGLYLQNESITESMVNVLIGVNYYVNDDIKLMGNMVIVKDYGPGFAARAQIAF
ncbi:phosphate-selective porin OprO and OprP [Marinicellulosiphila megalodicopiae]